MSCDFLELAAPGVRALKPYQPGKPESEVRREYGLTEVVKLASNENPLGPSPRAVAAIQSCLDELARYPDGNGFELKATLSDHLGVSVSNLTLGNGSNDVLELIARAFLTSDRAAVFSRHAFAVYYLATQATDAEARIAEPYPPDHEMPYGHDLDAMAAKIDNKTRVVFIANPNNPTGTWLSHQGLQDFLQKIPDQVLVVVDEAYFEYVEDPEYEDVMTWIPRFPNLIVTRTFSKAYGLAGLRIGYAVSHPQVADILNRVRQPFNVNIPAQAAAVAALGDREYLQHSRSVNKAGMRQLRCAFDEMDLQYLPSACNFLCVNMGRPGEKVFQALLRQGVIVRPVSNYGLPEFLRITIGTEAQNERLIRALKQTLAA